jgi:hypothetical protein
MRQEAVFFRQVFEMKRFGVKLFQSTLADEPEPMRMFRQYVYADSNISIHHLDHRGDCAGRLTNVPVHIHPPGPPSASVARSFPFSEHVSL